MKKMTKVISLVLALVMCLALCACGKKDASYKMLDEKVSTEQYAIGMDVVLAHPEGYEVMPEVEEIAKKYSDYNLDAMLCLDKQTETTFDAAQASDEFKARTTFTVGFDAEYPPYGYMGADGEYTGFDLDLAQAVCDIYNWELVKTPIDWDTKDVILNAGQIDCIWNGFTMTGREDSYTFSVPYIDNSIVVVTLDNSGINSLADLKDKTVVAQAGSSALSALEDPDGAKDLADTFKELQQTPDYNTAMMNLKSGLVDAVAIDIGVAQYYLSQQG